MNLAIEELIEGFKQLTRAQQHDVINQFYKHLVQGEIGISTIKGESDKLIGEKCPYCKSNSYIANGRLKGVRRYKCKECGKFFSETTGTTIEGLHKKDKFSHYLWCMFMDHSILYCR